MASSFATTKERDEWIRKEVKAKEGSRKQMQKQLDALKGQIPALETEVARLKEVSFPSHMLLAADATLSCCFEPIYSCACFVSAIGLDSSGKDCTM